MQDSVLPAVATALLTHTCIRKRQQIANLMMSLLLLAHARLSHACLSSPSEAPFFLEHTTAFSPIQLC